MVSGYPIVSHHISPRDSMPANHNFQWPSQQAIPTDWSYRKRLLVGNTEIRPDWLYIILRKYSERSKWPYLVHVWYARFLLSLYQLYPIFTIQIKMIDTCLSQNCRHSSLVVELKPISHYSTTSHIQNPMPVFTQNDGDWKVGNDGETASIPQE